MRTEEREFFHKLCAKKNYNQNSLCDVEPSLNPLVVSIRLSARYWETDHDAFCARNYRVSGSIDNKTIAF